MHLRYKEWIDYIFDHPVEKDAWHWDLDSPCFTATKADLAKLIHLTFTHSGKDLARFSDAQVNQGIWFLTSPSCSDYMFSLIDPTVSLDLRIAAIKSIYHLYRDCFQPRCSESLSHLNQQSSSKLNPICYMFWDVAPINYFADTNDDNIQLLDTILSVLADTLAIPHLACQEAAIHGYSHLSYSHPEQVSQAVNLFLCNPTDNLNLREYATDTLCACSD